MDMQSAIDLYKSIAALRRSEVHPRYEIHPHAERVLAMPRALGAPYGTSALQQWTKRERIHARLRIARKGH